MSAAETSSVVILFSIFLIGIFFILVVLFVIFLVRVFTIFVVLFHRIFPVVISVRISVLCVFRSFGIFFAVRPFYAAYIHMVLRRLLFILVIHLFKCVVPGHTVFDIFRRNVYGNVLQNRRIHGNFFLRKSLVGNLRQADAVCRKKLQIRDNAGVAFAVNDVVFIVIIFHLFHARRVLRECFYTVRGVRRVHINGRFNFS